MLKTNVNQSTVEYLERCYAHEVLTGTVTTVSCGDLAVLFTTSEASTTTTPALVFNIKSGD